MIRCQKRQAIHPAASGLKVTIGRMAWNALAVAVAVAVSGRSSAAPGPELLAVPDRASGVLAADLFAATANDAIGTTVAWIYEDATGTTGLGTAVCTVGDLNGDGYSDVAVGAPTLLNAFGSPDGGVLIFFGSLTGLPATPSQVIPAGRVAAGTFRFGEVLSPAGDVNGDGLGDLLIGMPGYGSDGAACVFLGSDSGLRESPVWFVAYNDGNIGNSGYGTTVDTAGDVDNDGYDDIVIGAPGSGGDDSGAVLLYRGGLGGPVALQSWSVSGAPGERLGTSVATAGDVNGDGFADVIVGAPRATGLHPVLGLTYHGAARVYQGANSGLGNAPATEMYGDVWPNNPGYSSEDFGYSVCTVGDHNGDGYADVVVLTRIYWRPNGTSGQQFAVFMGSPTGASADRSVGWNNVNGTENIPPMNKPAGDLNGDGLGDWLHMDGHPPLLFMGSRNHAASYPNNLLQLRTHSTAYSDRATSAAAAGDVDGDGFGDAIAGARFLHDDGTIDREQVMLFRGGGGSLWYNDPTSAGWTSVGAVNEPWYVNQVSCAGDVNGDGFDDLLVASPNRDAPLAVDGLISLYFGGADGDGVSVPAVADWRYAKGVTHPTVSGAGDVNGDGYDDIMLGSGRTVKGWYGGPLGPGTGAADWTLEVLPRLVTAVASAGDVNGDGYGDIVVGDSEGVYGDEGRAYVFLGSPDGRPLLAWQVSGGQLGARLGGSVSGAGDVDGDGFDDIIIGADLYQGEDGLALVFYGGPEGVDLDRRDILNAGGGSHISVSTAGDVDGDGYADVIIGSPEWKFGLGQAVVFRGDQHGISTTPYWTFIGTVMGTGSSVASAGDVNADGLSDVIIGASVQDANNIFDSGHVWVFVGPLSDGSETTPYREWQGTDAHEGLGRIVSGAGDFNGDGFADVAAGAPGYFDYATTVGRAVIWYGNYRSPAHGLVADFKPWRCQQRRDDDSARIGIGNRANGLRSRLQAWSGSAAGHSDLRLEWQYAMRGTSLVKRNLAVEPWRDLVGHPAGISVPLQTPPITAPELGAAHWRLRVASRSPYFPHSIWLSPSRNGREETDIRHVSSSTSSVEPGALLSTASFGLEAAPNPFNPRTVLSFDLRREGVVKIEIFDVAGHLVKTLVDEMRPAGRVDVVWQGTDHEGRVLASGTYFARAAGDGDMATTKLTLVR